MADVRASQSGLREPPNGQDSAARREDLEEGAAVLDLLPRRPPVGVRVARPVRMGRNELIRSMLTVRTLTDGGQQPLEIARAIADFCAPAKRTLEIALYDLKLGAETEPVVVGAIEGAAARGVAVRLAYNVDHRAPIP